MMPNRLPAGCPQGKRGLPDIGRDRTQRFAGCHNDDRQNQTGQGQSPREDALAKAKLINKQSQGHQPVKNRRNPR